MSATVPPNPAPSPTAAAEPAPPGARRAAIRSALSMRVGPLSILVALVILVPLGLLANRQLARTLRTQSDLRIQTVALRYAALAQAAAGTRAGAEPDSATLAILQAMFATAGAGDVSVELADSSGRTLVATRGLTPGDAQALAALAATHGDSVMSLATSHGTERVALAPANLGRWTVVAHLPAAQAQATYLQLRTGLLVIAALLFAIIVGVGFAVDRLVNDRIRRPAMELAAVAEAVAAGNLTLRVNPVESSDEIERLARSLSAMVTELRRLARGLAESAAETSTMSMQITAGTEQMSASASQIAQTASDLSGQSGTMAESIQALTTAAGQLAPLVEALSAGAREGVERNARLRALAEENRRVLDRGSAALDALSGDVQATSDAVGALVSASEEIRTFVALVQSLARNSKLLALNAAMEAARAGDQGEGFSVVAAEVRRLSAMSSDAAERTQQVVAEVTSGVERSRQNMERMAAAARDVRRATEQGSASFTQIEASVSELDQWTASIEAAAGGTDTLAHQVLERLDEIARGTESFAAAMQQVAASSEQQSASSGEIAAAAGAMSHAAERLRTLVANLRIGGTRQSGPVNG